MKPLIKHVFKSTLLLIFMISLTTVSGQDMQVQKQTDALVRAYQADLGMTIEQAEKFHKKVMDYEIRRKEIHAKKLEATEELNALKALSKQETTEMGSILSAQQLKLYKKNKKTLQPK